MDQKDLLSYELDKKGLSYTLSRKPLIISFFFVLSSVLRDSTFRFVGPLVRCSVRPMVLHTLLF